MNKKIVIPVLVLLFIFVGVVSAKTLAEINANYEKQVNAEIERRHELELQARQIEVLGRLAELQSGDVNVHNSAHSSAGAISKVKTVSKVNN